MSNNNQTALLSLWHSALNRPMHNVACGCFVPSAIRIDGLSLELDLIDYVEDKHALNQISTWKKALENRSEKRDRSFPDWINSLKGQCLSFELHDFVIADITKTLSSMVEHSARRLAPIDSMSQGWLGNRNIT